MKKCRNHLLCTILVILVWRIVWGAAEVSADQQSVGEAIRSSKSQEIRKYMNDSADPCENFYEFACGYWNKINPATSMANPTTGFMVSLLKTLDRKLRKMLVTDQVTDTASDRTVKYFYQSCLNTREMSGSYSERLKEIVKEFGEMHAWSGDNWREQDFDWMKTVARIAYKYDIHLMLKFDVGKASVDTTENGLFIDQPSLYWPTDSYFLDGEMSLITREYKKEMVFNLNKYLDLKEEAAQSIAQEIVDFELAMAKGIVDRQTEEKFYDPATIAEVHEMYSADLDMEQQINITLGTLPHLKVYTNKAYIENLIQVVKDTPQKVVANYIFYNLLHNFILEIPATEQQLEDHCMIRAKTYFIMHLDNMIYRRYSTKAVEQGIVNMWLQIKSAFKVTLESSKLNWIQEATRRQALEKLSEMKLEFVSYQQQIDSNEFAPLSLSPYDYIDNLKILMALKASKERSKLSATSATASHAEFWSPNPYYMLNGNAVKIPASMLLPHYTWSRSFPNALNFGMLGTMLSHEIIHGFDQTGSNYDARGYERDWWDRESANAFKHRTKCFIDQYKMYIFGDRRLPEMSDQGENIADNGGIRLAYEAYLQWLASKGQTNASVDDLERMTGLDDYNNKQLFFISYAHMWCSDTFADFRNIQTSIDVHVPAEFRVIGPLSNLEEFSKDFTCAKGSAMNPFKKCEIY